MSDENKPHNERKTLTLRSDPGRFNPSGPGAAGMRGVIVETKKRRRIDPTAVPAPVEAPQTPNQPVTQVPTAQLPPQAVAAAVVETPAAVPAPVAVEVAPAPAVAPPAVAAPAAPAPAPAQPTMARPNGRGASGGRRLTKDEMSARNQALETAQRDEALRRAREAEERAARERAAVEAVTVVKGSEAPSQPVDAPVVRRGDLPVVIRRDPNKAPLARPGSAPSVAPAPSRPVLSVAPGSRVADDAAKRSGASAAARFSNARPPAGNTKPSTASTGKPDPARDRGRRMTVTAALSDEDERVRSVSAFRRQISRDKMRAKQGNGQPEKVYREVILPDAISVQDIAARMSERAADVIKELMKLGMMVGINHVLDADTAQLVAEAMGHTVKRVSESAVETGLILEDDSDELKVSRPPVVTVMGHVDHGKTSLLDALRRTKVASGEAGGITQHIGAYRAHTADGRPITFIDTPGHAAFTAMRARGAAITDIVILTVAADDGVMPQTIEAIAHAKAAGVPLIIAINKIDKPDAKPERVRTELLQHEVVVESMSGDVLDVEVSATQGIGLDKLLDAVLLQAEMLNLRANPDRAAEGRVVEAQLDKGRGPVATVLVRRGTLKAGDIVVAGAHWGRVRALTDETGARVQSAEPSVPVEVLGLDGVPSAGDEFIVVENEAKAREVTEYRQRKKREASSITVVRSMDVLMAQLGAAEKKLLPLIVKADVQGSLEAIVASLQKLGNDEVGTQILHASVGGITESDVMLANASSASIVAFNVRAMKQSRDLAEREKIEIRYYSVIYDMLDDVKGVLSGMLKPIVREKFLGNAEILQVFDISKTGKVAGCKVTEGIARRSAKVRLVRENTVIHEGTLSTLRRFKDEVREVSNGYECGMAFARYEDIRVGDVIEIFETEEIARSL